MCQANAVGLTSVEGSFFLVIIALELSSDFDVVKTGENIGTAKLTFAHCLSQFTCALAHCDYVYKLRQHVA